MFGLGFSEILVILIVALLVFGPEKLPEIARTLGRTIGEFRKTLDEAKREFTFSAFHEPDPAQVSGRLRATSVQAPTTTPEALTSEPAEKNTDQQGDDES